MAAAVSRGIEAGRPYAGITIGKAPSAAEAAGFPPVVSDAEVAQSGSAAPALPEVRVALPPVRPFQPRRGRQGA